jgi:hypothetical protein
VDVGLLFDGVIGAAPNEEGQAVFGGGGPWDALAMSSPARRGQYSRKERGPLRESGVIVVTGNRVDALARLDVFVG